MNKELEYFENDVNKIFFWKAFIIFIPNHFSNLENLICHRNREKNLKIFKNLENFCPYYSFLIFLFISHLSLT